MHFITIEDTRSLAARNVLAMSEPHNWPAACAARVAKYWQAQGLRFRAAHGWQE
jgi:hypothetical protein